MPLSLAFLSSGFSRRNSQEFRLSWSQTVLEIFLPVETCTGTLAEAGRFRLRCHYSTKSLDAPITRVSPPRSFFSSDFLFSSYTFPSNTTTYPLCGYNAFLNIVSIPFARFRLFLHALPICQHSFISTSYIYLNVLYFEIYRTLH